MELVKNNWKNNDVKEFQKYLKSFEDKDKIEWTKNLLKTNMPVLAIKSPVIKDIAKQIYKGNYLEYLDLMIWEYYENTAVNGFLISKITDFDVMKKYLDIYSSKVDNWATCDLLSFNIKGNEERFYSLVLEYIKSKEPFVRRIGMSILFNYIDKDDYIDSIFELLDYFKDEGNYYVNMMNSWLVCECYIKQRNRTLKYLENNNLNKFTINKAIQKCRDSYRITKEDKDMLLKFKIK